MIKSCFSCSLNGISTYCAIINVTSVVFSMVFENTIQYHWIIQESYLVSMILSITNCSIINQTLVVFSMLLENITQYVPLDHSVLKHFFSGTLNGI